MYKLPEAEPYRVKVIEPLKMTTREQREAILKRAHYNIFNLPAEDVYIDLLTDSGTSAMSQNQWAGMMTGDESYAFCRNWYHLEDTIKDITGFKYIVPTHQGRPAENILTMIHIRPGLNALGNMFFDSTHANVETKGGIPHNLVIAEGLEPAVEHPFKGNIDIQKLEDAIKTKGRENVAFILITVTCNNNGGQPVSMENLRSVREVADRWDLPFFLDAARFAENAYFIKLREDGYAQKSTFDIAREMFALADGATMSAKKDAIVNIGGFLCMNDESLYQRACNELILREGFPTYGGLAGRDLDAMATGLWEGLDESYLAYRLNQTSYLGECLLEAGVPIVEPPGGHAIYIDAGQLLPHISQAQFPGQALSIELYREGGIRTSEIGSVMFAHPSPETGVMVYPALELVRLAIPRRVYTQSHLDYVVEVCAQIAAHKADLRGVRFTYAPKLLRHFTARFEPV